MYSEPKLAVTWRAGEARYAPIGCDRWVLTAVASGPEPLRGKPAGVVGWGDLIFVAVCEGCVLMEMAQNVGFYPKTAKTRRFCARFWALARRDWAMRDRGANRKP